jgi:hypothetical protein
VQTLQAEADVERLVKVARNPEVTAALLKRLQTTAPIGRSQALEDRRSPLDQVLAYRFAQ